MGLVLGIASIGMQVAGMAAQAKANDISAQGVVQQAQADYKNYSYQSQVAANNAKYARQNAQWAFESGEQQLYSLGLKTRSEIGSMKADQGAAGVDVNSGSARQVRDAMDQIGRENSAAGKSNEQKDIYTYNVQSQSYEDQSRLFKMAADEALRAGGYNSAAVRAGGRATMLGSAASIANNAYQLWQTMPTSRFWR